MWYLWIFLKIHRKSSKIEEMRYGGVKPTNLIKLPIVNNVEHFYKLFKGWGFRGWCSEPPTWPGAHTHPPPRQHQQQKWGNCKLLKCNCMYKVSRLARRRSLQERSQLRCDDVQTVLTSLALSGRQPPVSILFLYQCLSPLTNYACNSPMSQIRTKQIYSTVKAEHCFRQQKISKVC